MPPFSKPYVPYWKLFSFLTPDGRTGSWNAKYYVYNDGAIFWEARALIQTLLPHRKNRIDTCREVDKDSINWEVFLIRLGVDSGLVVMPSRRQLEVRGEESKVGQKNRADITLDTMTMLTVILVACVQKRRICDRMAARMLLLAVLSEGLPNNGDISDALSALCDEHCHLCGDNLDECCSHLELARCPAAQEVRGNSAAHRTEAAMATLAQNYLICAASCAVLRDLAVLHIVPMLGDRLPAKSSSDPLLHADVQGHRKRPRLDEDLRRHLTQVVVQKRQAQSGAVVARTHGLDADIYRKSCGLEMAAYQQAAWRSFDKLSGVFAVAEDATRLGQPAEETVCYEFMHGASGLTVVLPNQASREQQTSNRSVCSFLGLWRCMFVRLVYPVTRVILTTELSNCNATVGPHVYFLYYPS